MYDVIALDLDGTLLNDNKIISKKTADVLNHLIDMGVEVIFVTGRRYWSSKKLTKKIRGDLYYICNNGAIIRNSNKDALIRRKCLAFDTAIQIISKFKEYNIYPIFHVDAFEKGYDILMKKTQKEIEYLNYVTASDRYKLIDKYTELKNEQLLEIVVIDTFQCVDNFKNILDKHFSNYVSFHIMKNNNSEFSFMEILDKNTNKWDTLNEFVNSEGNIRKKIIAIGDDNNDIELIKNADLGIALKNASEEVKTVANIISEYDNNNDAIAYELNKIFELGKG